MDDDAWTMQGPVQAPGSACDRNAFVHMMDGEIRGAPFAQTNAFMTDATSAKLKETLHQTVMQVSSITSARYMWRKCLVAIQGQLGA